MTLKIRPIQEKDYEKVHVFQRTFLDEDSYEDFVQRVESNPDLYLVAYLQEDLAGVVYGNPSKNKQTVINLQGIAVDLDKKFARKGIGSKLMEAFEKVVKEKGYQVIGVGSADDSKIESFYLKNGFKPIELVAKDEEYNELERMAMNDYEEGLSKKEELREKHNPREVIFIFEKELK